MFKRIAKWFKKNNKIKSSNTKLDLDSSNKTNMRKRLLFAKGDELSLIQKLKNEDKNAPENKKFLATENFEGITKKRIRTEFYWIITPIITIAIFLLYFLIVFAQGNPDKLAYGIDFRALPCGLGRLNEKPYLYFLQPNIDLNVKMCVNKCPEGTNYILCLYRPDGINEHSDDRFCYTSIQSKRRGKYCIPVEVKTKSTVNSHLNSIFIYLGRILGDVYLGRDVITAGFIATLLLTNLIVFFFRFKLMLLTFSIVISLSGPFIFIYFAYAYHIEYNDLKNKQCPNIMNLADCLGVDGRLLNFMKYVFLVVGGLLFLYLLISISRLINGIRLFVNTNKLFKQIYNLRVIYLLCHIIQVALTIIFSLSIIHGYAFGNVDIINAVNIDGNKVKTFHFSLLSRILLIIILLALYYLKTFISIFNRALAIFVTTDWYFTRKKQSARFNVGRSLFIIIKYHIGTIAKVAVFESVFQFQKNILMFIYSILKNSNQKTDRVRFAMSASYMFIIYYNDFLRFQDPQALIHTALNSTRYSDSYRTHYYLKYNRNIKFRLKALNWLRKLLFLFKLFITGSIAVGIHIYVRYVGINMLETLKVVDFKITIAVFYFIFSWNICSSFFDSYMDVLETICICYLIDTEMFVGDQLYVENLQNSIDKWEEIMRLLDIDKRFLGIKILRGNDKSTATKVSAAKFKGSEEFNKESDDLKNGSDDFDIGEYMSAEYIEEKVISEEKIK